MDIVEKKPFLILIDGPMGSGKTTVSIILHKKLKRTSYIGLDRIKRYISDFKKNPHDNEISRNVVVAMTDAYLKQGINVIIEQGMRKDHIEIFKKIAKKNNAKCYIYQLTAPKKLLTERVHLRTALQGKPRTSNARIERNYKLHLENKYPHSVIFDSEKMEPEKIATLILKDIKK